MNFESLAVCNCFSSFFHCDWLLFTRWFIRRVSGAAVWK